MSSANDEMNLEKRSPGRRSRKIVLGMIEVSGYWVRMHQGLTAIGEDVTLLCLDEHPFDYGGPDTTLMVRAIRHLRAGKRTLLDQCLETVLRGLLLARYAATHDTFVFGYRTSFFNGWDLWLLRMLGKTIVMVFHGSDERPPYMDGALGPIHDDELAQLTAAQKRRLDRCHRNARLLISNPNSAQLQRGQCVIYHVIGIPVASRVGPLPARPGTAAGRTIRALHAPSNPAAKGTEMIRDICAELRAKGLDLELVEVTGVTNLQVQEAMLDADLVIDQVYSDCPWPVVSAEAALLGRPSVIGGYGHEHLARFMPPGTLPPGEYCTPDGLAESISRLASDEEYRLALGDRMRRFATEVWSPTEVAQRLMAAINGTAPDDWYFDAEEVRYTGGCSISLEQLRARVRALLTRHGASSLCVDDKPDLRDRLIDEAG